MHKILVTTDFSTNSKAGIRFAIQLASQHKYQLTFFHSYNIMKAPSWSEAKANAFEKEESSRIQIQLNHFIGKIYKDLKMVAKNVSCEIESAVFPDVNVREYAEENDFSYICISTRGAGKFKRILGTNTSNLINFSDVPVIAIPSSYRTKKITSILYASDLTDLQNELKKVVEFAKPLKAKVELLHFITPAELIPDAKIIQSAMMTFSKYEIKLQLAKPNPLESLISNLESAIKKSKPSLMIMFTQQNRTFFEKLFLPSKSAGYSFNAKVPLIVFNKS